MQKRIIIYLNSTDLTQASWIVLDKENKIIESADKADLTQLSSANEADVYVVVPAQDVLLTEAELPKLSRQRMLQALPFALEEQLIEDVSELHFAIDEYQSDGKLPVAIISNQKMTTWLTQLEQHKIAPLAFIPAVFILPHVNNEWHINLSISAALVRTGKLSGFACEPSNLETLVDLKSKENPENQPINITRTQFSEQQLLEKYAADLSAKPFINLLQGKYQAKPQANKTKKIWKIAGYLVIALIALAFVSNIISFFILQHQVSQMETVINQIYKRNFPNATAIVAPRERMTEKLRTVSGQAGKNNFLAILAKLGKSLSEFPGIQIKNLDFREQRITLEIMASNFDYIDGLIKKLSQQGLIVKQQNATTIGSQVKATLLIQAGAS